MMTIIWQIMAYITGYALNDRIEERTCPRGDQHWAYTIWVQRCRWIQMIAEMRLALAAIARRFEKHEWPFEYAQAIV